MITPPQVTHRVQRAARAANCLSESTTPPKADVARGARRAISSIAGAVLDDDAAGVLVTRDTVDVCWSTPPVTASRPTAPSRSACASRRPLANTTVTLASDPPGFLDAPSDADERALTTTLRTFAIEPRAYNATKQVRVLRELQEAAAVRRAPRTQTALSLSRDFASARRRACARRAPRDARAAARALGSFRMRPPYKIRDS